MNRFRILFFNGYNARVDFQSALACASEGVRDHYRDTGDLSECFALIYDKLNRHRTLVWLNDDLKVKFRKVF